MGKEDLLIPRRLLSSKYRNFGLSLILFKKIDINNIAAIRQHTFQSSHDSIATHSDYVETFIPPPNGQLQGE